MRKRRADDEPLSPAELGAIRQAFEAAGYIVTPLNEACFEFRSPTIPAATHVYATPYFLQFTGVSIAVPRSARGRDISVRDRLLNQLNCRLSLVKVTCEEVRISRKLGGWQLQVQARLVPGLVRATFATETIRGFVALWLHERLQLVLAKEEFERGVYAMADEQPS
ncbi:MAG TPA: hypothetical protein VG734_09315 [Lacunisphaera sp.]|nr:hypothetical protein [Lacunisphaera sp.]